MDDFRYLWIRDRVYAGLNILETESGVFDEFLTRDDGENETLISKFLTRNVDEEDDGALIFHKLLNEEEIEVQIELSTLPFSLFFA